MKPMNINELMDAWDKDSVIDKTEPGKEILRIPILHSKYVKQHSAHSLAAKQASYEYARMKKIKWEYYNGKMDESELKKFGWEPFRFLVKQDVQIYLDADDDLIKLLARKALSEQSVDFCTSVLKELNSRTYQLRAFIDFEKFINGQN